MGIFLTLTDTDQVDHLAAANPICLFLYIYILYLCVCVCTYRICICVVYLVDLSDQSGYITPATNVKTLVV